MVETARRAFAHTAWTGGKFLLVVGAFIAYLAYPPAAWILEINSVHVDNAVAGVPPMMEVDRVIHQNFEGEWTATVMRKGTPIAPRPAPTIIAPTPNCPTISISTGGRGRRRAFFRPGCTR